MVTEWRSEGSIGSLLNWRLRERPDHPFLYVEDDGPWTYRQLAAASVGIADELRRHGVSAGDKVIVRIGNDERFLPAVCAVWTLGAAAIAMHPAAPVQDIGSVADGMAAAALVCPSDDPALRDAVLPTIEVARLSPTDRLETARLADRFSLPADQAGADPALVLLTSGSTGQPKGVVLTHDNAWSNLAATVSAFRRDTRPSPITGDPKPPNLIANPLSHTAGVVRLLFALYVGRSVVLLRKFDGAATKRLVDRHGIDNLTINPAMLRMLLEQLPAGADLGPVRYVSSGTAPLTPALREAFEGRFGVPVLQAYGQTEAFGGIAIESARDVLKGRRRPGSVGKPLPGVELRIVGPDGSVAGQGEEGEIWVRSKSATAGYIGDGSASTPVDADGWLHTGDLGMLDDDGYLFITGRLKNIIICGGFNIVPEEIEAALAADDGVREAVVVAAPDERLGEIPVAVVESDHDAGAVATRVAAKLASYKRPRRVFTVESLPRVPNGKVDRPAATRMAQALCATAVAAP